MSEPSQMAIKLNEANLEKLSDDIQVPSYDRSQLKTGIVHIGPGNFFKAHQAKYIEDVLEQGDLRWGICAVSLRSSDLRDELADQDNLYSLFSRDGDGESGRIMGCLTDILVAREDPQAVVNQMADPDVKLVTMTVTQNGYYYNHNSNTLDFDHPDIQQCLDETSDPTSTVGYIVAALEKRMQEGTQPFTVMSCDNVPGNGNVLRAVVEAYAERKSPQLREWIHDNVKFPNTMVDRITPKTTQDTVDEAHNAHQLNDKWPVFTETFTQWVIEDKSCNDLPDFASVGADIVDDVHGYELMKIRMLNGSHMALGTIGHLCDFKYADEAINHQDVYTFISNFMDEQINTLPSIKQNPQDPAAAKAESLDFYKNKYKPDLIKRLENPYMFDELTRLARNGSQKAPTRLLRPAQEAIAHQSGHDHLAFGVAAWMRYLTGEDANGKEFDINDTEAVRMGLQDLAQQGTSARTLFAVKEVFGSTLLEHPDFSDEVQKHLQSINDKGMLAALAEFNDEYAAKKTADHDLSSGFNANQPQGEETKGPKRDFKP